MIQLLRKCGVTKDEKDMRGRWKKTGRVSDACDDIELPYPDAKVAGKLCIGGPVKHKIKANEGITNAFILQHVTPAVRTRLGDDVATVLGKALMWLAFSEKSDFVPAALKDRITGNCNAIRPNGFEGNPIEKVLIVISGSEGEVYFDEITAEDNNTAAGNRNQPSDLRNAVVALSYLLIIVRE